MSDDWDWEAAGQLRVFEDDLATYLKYMDDRSWGRILARLDVRDQQRLARLLIRELP